MVRMLPVTQEAAGSSPVAPARTAAFFTAWITTRSHRSRGRSDSPVSDIGAQVRHSCRALRPCNTKTHSMAGSNSLASACVGRHGADMDSGANRGSSLVPMNGGRRSWANIQIRHASTRAPNRRSRALVRIRNRAAGYSNNGLQPHRGNHRLLGRSGRHRPTESRAPVRTLCHLWRPAVLRTLRRGM